MSDVQLIDEQGKPRGIVPTSEALKLAEAAGFDLVEVNPTAKPPIAKILDFGQFQYKQQKIIQAQKVKAKKVEVKGIRLSIKIGEHDLAVRQKQSMKFLDEGHKVRLEVILRGRERSRGDLAKKTMDDFIARLGEGVVVEVPLSRQGGNVSMQIGKRKGTGKSESTNV